MSLLDDIAAIRKDQAAILAELVKANAALAVLVKASAALDPMASSLQVIASAFKATAISGVEIQPGKPVSH